jgi:hypothetical protein
VSEQHAEREQRVTPLELSSIATVVPALVALTLVATVWVALHAYEIIWWREARAQTRALRLPAPS